MYVISFTIVSGCVRKLMSLSFCALHSCSSSSSSSSSSKVKLSLSRRVERDLALATFRDQNMSPQEALQARPRGAAGRVTLPH